MAMGVFAVVPADHWTSSNRPSAARPPSRQEGKSEGGLDVIDLADFPSVSCPSRPAILTLPEYQPILVWLAHWELLVPNACAGVTLACGWPTKLGGPGAASAQG